MKISFKVHFDPPKKIAHGNIIHLQTPLTLKTPILTGKSCPFGIDQETDWKWSIKMEFDPNTHLEYQFAKLIETLDAAVLDKVQNAWFPSTHKDYFYMHSVYTGKGTKMRAKIPVKMGISSTTFTGNTGQETQRLITVEDSNVLKDPAAKFQFTLKWSSVWLMEESKTIGCDWTITDITLL